MKPLVVIESHIPDVPERELSQWFEVRRLAPADITPESVRGAAALIVRTRTRCDAALLAGSDVRFVATATIGTDHIDLPWCASAGIEVTSAPGCNAPAVAQYVLSCICRLCNPAGLTLGVVGVGHVGSIIADHAEADLAMRVLRCDPPRAGREGSEGFADISRVQAEADIITFHVPLTRSPQPHPTLHMADAAFFAACRKRPLIINSARGPVVDTPALVAALDEGTVCGAVIDCWEGEPDIDRSLLARAAYATPHIAGYSREGKLRATSMAVNALCRHFGIPWRMEPDVLPGAAAVMTPSAIVGSYDPAVDTWRLRTSPRSFEALRNHYALRPEVP